MRDGGILLSKLIEISSAPLGSATVGVIEGPEGTERVIKELDRLLRGKNGFFAFESALHVFPSDPSVGDDLGYWNAESTWRFAYSELAGDCLFFAEDAFGEQFCIAKGGVFRFEPEAAELSFISEDLAGWATKILSDYQKETGWRVAHDWQIANGFLKRGTRLVPRQPFVLQGEYSIDNLLAVDAALGMKYRAELAKRIHGTPDGQSASFMSLDEFLAASRS